MTLVVAASAGDVVVWIVWVVASAACLASAVGVVSFADPFYSALALIGNLASLAVLYLLLSAEFVAAAQVLIYAGAIVVMFLFVIAYVSGRADAPWAGAPSIQTWAGIAAAAAILIEVLVVIGVEAGGGDFTTEADISAAFGGPAVDRRAVPDRPPARVRDHVDRAARRGRRRRHPRLTRPPVRRGERPASSARARRRVVPGHRGRLSSPSVLSACSCAAIR